MSMFDLLGDARELLATLPEEVNRFKASWVAATQGMKREVVPAVLVQTVETTRWSIAIYLIKTHEQDCAVAVCRSLHGKDSVCAALPVEKEESPDVIAKNLFNGILKEFRET